MNDQQPTLPPRVICSKCKKGELLFIEAGMSLIVRCPNCKQEYATTSMAAMADLVERHSRSKSGPSLGNRSHDRSSPN